MQSAEPHETPPVPSAPNEGDGTGEPVLAPERVLVRARKVLVNLTDEDEIGIDVDGERISAPRVALAVLDAFATPRTVSDVLASIARGGSQQAEEAASCVYELLNDGVLVDPEDRDALGARGWIKPGIHLVMLDDRARTGGFCDALRALVKPDDVVVDIGTGTGVLATCAALAGARRVYAVESSGIAEVAGRVFAANRVSDRITLVRERSTSVSLPERGTILVTETIGNDPLDEQILEIVADAKRRLLAPDARVIPSALEIWGVAVDIPRSVIERHVFTKRKVARYTADYGIDFSPLEDHRLSCSEPVMLDGRDVATWPLAPPVLLASVDMTQPFETSISTRVMVQISRDAESLGVMLAFRATLAPGIVISTLPDDYDPLSHWAHALFPSFDCPTVKGGTTLAIDYSYDRRTTTVRVTEAD